MGKQTLVHKSTWIKGCRWEIICHNKMKRWTNRNIHSNRNSIRKEKALSPVSTGWQIRSENKRRHWEPFYGIFVGCIHSVYWGINLPSKTPLPLFSKPPPLLNLPTVQAPLSRQLPYILVFRESPPLKKIWDFSVYPKNIKHFDP